MKKVAYTFIYVALVGFFVTTIVNLLHRPDAGIYTLIASCFSLLIGGVTILFYKLTNAAPGNGEKYKKLKRTVVVVRVAAYILVLAGLVMYMQGLSYMGMTLLFVGINISIFGSIYRAYTQGQISSTAYSLSSMVLLYLAFVFVITGLFFKIQHFPGGAIILLSGIVLFLITLILLLYQTIISSKTRTPLLMKAGQILIYLSAFVCFIGLILVIYHWRSLGNQLITYSLLGLIGALAINFFTPANTYKVLLNPVIYRLNMLTKAVANFGITCFVLALLFKIRHYQGVQILYLMGIITLLVALIVASYLRRNRYLAGEQRKELLLNTPLQLSSDEMNEYIGVYHNEELKTKITVAQSNNGTELVAQANDKKQFALAAIDKNIFKFDPDGIIMEFQPDEGQLMVMQFGGEFKFIKIH